MYNHMLIIGLFILAVGLFLYWGQKPRLGSLNPEELKDSAEYHNRINRKGVFTPAKYAAVISFERIWR
jgi:hypothetical protein